MTLISEGIKIDLPAGIPIGFFGISVDKATNQLVLYNSTGILGTFTPGTGIALQSPAITPPANYPPATVGQAWFFDGDGQIGGAAGPQVQSGELLICISDTAGGDEAAAGTSFEIDQVNIDVADVNFTGGNINGLTTLSSAQTLTDLLQALTDVVFTVAGFDSAAEGDDGNDLITRGGQASDGVGGANGSNSGDIISRSTKGGDAIGAFDGGNSGNATVQSSAGGAAGAGQTGGDSGVVTINSQQGGNGGLAGGNSGIANIQTDDGGDSIDAGGTGGNAGDAQVVAGNGGADAEGSAGTGGNGGDVQLTAGNGGAGNTPGLNGTINSNNLEKHLTVGALVALGGGGQAGATLLTGTYSEVGTVAAPDDSVIVVPATVGSVYEAIINSGANSMDVFPDGADTIEGGASIAVAINGFIKLVCITAGNWKEV